jgi:hypothetical protein
MSRHNKIFLFPLIILILFAACGSSSSTPEPEADPVIRLFYYVPDLGGAMVVGKAEGEEPDHMIYSATSSDGTSFTQEEGVRFQRQFITDPDVFMAAEGEYVMFTSEGSQIIRATSTAANGTYTESASMGWDNGAICSTVPIGDKLVTFYCDTAASGIGYAFYDIESGTLSPQGTALENPFGTGVVCDPTIVQLEDGTYQMYYKYREPDAPEGPMNDSVYLATSSDGFTYEGNALIKESASVPGAIRVGSTIYLYYVDGMQNSTAVGVSQDNGATFEFGDITMTDGAGPNLWDPDPIAY